MDIVGAYRGGVYKQHISAKEIAKMKKNMKKVPVIQLKSDIYHNQEANEAESILGNISSIQQTEPGQPTPQTKEEYGLISKIRSLRQRFISLF